MSPVAEIHRLRQESPRQLRREGSEDRQMLADVGLGPFLSGHLYHHGSQKRR